MGMKLSIVIPNYNNPQLLAQCLHSIAKVEPDVSRYSVIVVDDGSSEENIQTIRELILDLQNSSFENGDLRLVEHETNKYFSQAVNTGIGCTESEFVLLMNSDIVCITPFIDNLTEAFEKDEKIGVVGAILLYPDTSIQHAGVALTNNGWFGHLGHKERLSETSPWLFPTYHLGVTGAFMAIRRKTIEDIGMFDTNYVGAYEDVEYCLRSWEKGWRVWMEPSVRAYHLEGATRGSNVTSKMERNPYMWYREQITTSILQSKMTSPYISQINAAILQARQGRKA